MRQDDLGDIKRVGPDIAEDIAGTCEFRVDAPARRGVLLLHRSAMEAMGELQVDDADLAEITIPDHGACLLDHLVVSIAVGHADDPAARPGKRLKFFGLGDREAERLFADHMQIMFECRFADREMGVVGCRDRHGLDAVGAPGFGRKHSRIVPVAPGFVEPQIEAEGAAAFGIDIEGTRHKGKDVVAMRCRAMNIADLAAFAAADHTPADRFCLLFVIVFP